MDKPFRLAINGLGRIGRMALRFLWDKPNLEVVAANSRSPLETYVYLVKYDSIYGPWAKEIKAQNDNILIDGRSLKLFHEDDPNNLPWGDLGIDLVIESTGLFRSREKVEPHLRAGAKRVLISAPAKDEDIPTIIKGINEEIFDPQQHFILSAASCTTCCLAPVVKVLQERFGITHGFMSTIHAYTNDQNLHDAPHKKDLRRARAAAASIIPTTTGAARAIDRLIPQLKGKLNGISLRVPLLVPSVIDLVVELNQAATKEEINQVFIEESKKPGLKELLAVSNEPLVSIDFKQNPHGSIVDLLSTEVVDGRLANIVSWYDNEWGYVAQMVRLIEYIKEVV